MKLMKVISWLYDNRNLIFVQRPKEFMILNVIGISPTKETLAKLSTYINADMTIDYGYSYKISH